MQKNYIIGLILASIVIMSYAIAIKIKANHQVAAQNKKNPPIQNQNKSNQSFARKSPQKQQPQLQPNLSTMPSAATITQKTKTKRNNKINQANSFPLIEPNLFKIIIPEKFLYPPRVDKQNIQTANNQLSAQFTSYSYQIDKKHYQIGFIRYPNDVFRRKTKEKLLQDLQNGQIKDFKGILKKSNTNYDAMNTISREIEIHSQDRGNALFIKSLITISEPFIFVITFSAPDQDLLSDYNTNKYFSSFELFHKNISQTVYIGN